MRHLSPFVIPRRRSEFVTFNFPCRLWPESSEEHLPTSIAEVLRLPRHKTLCYVMICEALRSG